MDRRAMERTMANIKGLLAEKSFGSLDEINSYVQGALAKGDLPLRRLDTPLERAQELMYDAWDAVGEERVRLARQALEISADCADSYVLLAEETAKSLKEALDLFRQGTEAGERALGTAVFAENAGELWGVIETRPYMRARLGLAQSLADSSDLRAAIEHASVMLQLNPNDNQGVRYLLLPWLLEVGDLDEAQELLDQFEGDISANWAYGRALLLFARDGDTPEARRALREAAQVNPYAPSYFLRQKRLPENLPDSVGLGDESEAIACVTEQIGGWLAISGSLAWMAGIIAASRTRKITPLRRR